MSSGNGDVAPSPRRIELLDRSVLDGSVASISSAVTLPQTPMAPRTTPNGRDAATPTPNAATPTPNPLERDRLSEWIVMTCKAIFSRLYVLGCFRRLPGASAGCVFDLEQSR